MTSLRAAISVALLGVSRFLWAYFKHRRAKYLKETDTHTARAAEWLARAVSHWLSKILKRRWVIGNALHVYVKNLRHTYAAYVIPGSGRILAIDDCYIPLGLRTGQMTDGTQLLDHDGVALLLGEPGSGKSALFAHLVRTMCNQCLQDGDESARLPLYIPLHSLSSVMANTKNKPVRPVDAAASLSNWFAENMLEPLDLFDSQDLFTRMANSENNGVVVLFDGLDELSSNDIGKAEDFIGALTEYLRAAAGRNLTVIASRQQALAFTGHLRQFDRLITVELQPFSNEAIYSFLLQFPYRSQFVPTIEARRIFTQLRLHPTLLETCSNPLALSLYVDRDARVRESGAATSDLHTETRAGFYQYIIDHLVTHRRVSQLGVPLANRPFQLSRTEFFVKVASDHAATIEPFNQISHDIMLNHAGSLSRELQSPEDALSELAKDTGIVRRMESGQWMFIHVSFLNYFLAYSLTNGTTKAQRDQILSQIRTNGSRYLEAFYLACGLMATWNSSSLYTLLTELGTNARVSQSYPRAMLESQAYLMADFPRLIRTASDTWKAKSEDDLSLLRDLVAVLVDYEVSCRDLGRTPLVTVRGLLWPDLRRDEASVLQLTRMDVELALKLAGQQTIMKILRDSPIEEAILTLYGASVLENLEMDEVIKDGKLSAIIAEGALRSTLVAEGLAPTPVPDSHTRIRSDRNAEPWVDAWPIRGTAYARVLSVALPYIRSCGHPEIEDYPHLELIQYVRPLRRLRYDLMFGNWRLSVLLVSIVVFLCSLVGLVLHSWFLAAIVAVLLSACLGYALRWGVLTGRVVLATSRILNLQLVSDDITDILGQAKKLVYGEPRALRRWAIRTPRSTGRGVLVLYERGWPFLWRRFCPQLGDNRLSPSGCADLQRELRTSDMRLLLRR